tara:strand:+ start:136 stop:348 length:213 start_codon:yes stop_codon:yes gene_type:complete
MRFSRLFAVSLRVYFIDYPTDDDWKEMREEVPASFMGDVEYARLRLKSVDAMQVEDDEDVGDGDGDDDDL